MARPNPAAPNFRDRLPAIWRDRASAKLYAAPDTPAAAPPAADPDVPGVDAGDGGPLTADPVGDPCEVERALAEEQVRGLGSDDLIFDEVQNIPPVADLDERLVAETAAEDEAAEDDL
jgi:hypothetical protein